MSRPGFYEFFAGGGMARKGLEPRWKSLFANDIDAMKCAAYRANFGGEDLHEGDVHALTPDDLPGQADLAWASFPCQDLSLAGARQGLKARRSGAFHGFWRLMEGLAAQNRAPRVIVIENVSGLASAGGGADLAVVLNALAAAGYAFDAQIIDAAHFLPQSRPRLFITGWTGAAPATGAPSPALQRALPHLSAKARAAMRPLALPAPPKANVSLAEVVEADIPFDPAFAADLLAKMAPPHLAKVEAAKREAAATGAPRYGALFRRMRGKTQRAEIRFDMAGCLRTPAGGSSRQILVKVAPDGALGARLMTGREAARLMGLADSYVLPARETHALHLAGDGVAVPVVKWLDEHLITPLLPRSLEPAAAAE